MPRPPIATALLATLAIAGCQKASVEVPRPEPKAITTGARYDGEPDISPDGTTLVYSAFGQADRDLFTLPAGGTAEPRLLFSGPGNDAAPRWSPDGKSVVFSSD